MTIKISKEKLEDLYLNQELTTTEIGETFNCVSTTIRRKLTEFGIKIRTFKEANNTKRYKGKYGNCNVGKNHPHWKGGIIRNSEGYILIWQPDHPRATKDGYVKRSRLVAEKMLGRYLYPNEIPHHKNEIKDDDKPENIDVMTDFGHKSLHGKNKEKNREKNKHGRYIKEIAINKLKIKNIS